ncbi:MULTISPECIES: hybrid sensor histidine kinase/response regulator [Novosphingobium]|uniref:hybrid sensor histidine kinase/response regulator n=1 Tax=Novosphingobium TaxID=165696 RepID=UPI0022F28465|nr:PAS domain-containing protein [Novosphingobium resinovorum]
MSHDKPRSIDGALARAVIDSAGDFAIITTDLTGIITSWNSGAEKLLGWSGEHALGMAIRLIFTPEDSAAGAVTDEMKRALAEGRAVDERWHMRKDGSRFWASGLLMPLHDDGQCEVHGFVKMMRDRTAERAADRRFSAMTAALPGFVFIADSDGNFVETNALFQTYCGRPAADLAGLGWIASVHLDDRGRAIELWDDAVTGGGIFEGRLRFRRHDGEYRCFACRGVPEHDEQARVVRWIGTCMDVENEARARTALERLNLSLERRATQSDADLATAIDELQAEIAERRQAEAALRQAQKMEALGQLTGGVAHDFNNLLMIIRSSAELLRRPDLSEEKHRRFVDAITDTADRAAGLTRQLLAFARRQPLQAERFDAALRVDNLTTLLETTVGSRINLRIDKQSADCMVEADANQFDTAILNMVVNARDAMGGEGELVITVDAPHGIPQRRGHPAKSAEYVAVAVVDTGTGIAREDLARVFEPFFTTKEVGQGTGLGLSQLFGFAKQSGGDVTVESEVGHGTTFTLFLPRVMSGQSEAEVSPPSAVIENGPATGCVLVVEDNQTVGEFAAQLLAELGYDTTWASNGQAALDLIREAPERFDLVFSDVVMPGMTGIELGQHLRKENPDLPVILTSGYSDALAREGAQGFPLLQKPYSVDALSRILRNMTASLK